MFKRIAAVALMFAVVGTALVVLTLRESGALHAVDMKMSIVRPGVELWRGSLKRGDSSGGELYALFLDPNVVEPSVIINESKMAMKETAKDAIVVLNGGFFTAEHRATGLIVAGGKQLTPLVSEGGAAGSGVFLLENGTPSLLTRSEAAARTFDKATLALQAGPRIIEPGGLPGIKSDDGQNANRTVIGADGRGRVAIVVVIGPTGWPTGPTLFELQGLLDHDLELSFALNLDGGPSTGLYLHGDPPLALSESAPVHSLIAWRLRAP